MWVSHPSFLLRLMSGTYHRRESYREFMFSLKESRYYRELLFTFEKKTYVEGEYFYLYFISRCGCCCCYCCMFTRLKQRLQRDMSLISEENWSFRATPWENVGLNHSFLILKLRFTFGNVVRVYFPPKSPRI